MWFNVNLTTDEVYGDIFFGTIASGPYYENKSNNHIDNLQPLTSKEHAEKTDNNNKKGGKTTLRPI